jgi:hypothetical protein
MNAQLIVNDFELDLSSAVAVPLNFAIADIKEPQKRRRSFSKSITLEGTQNNLNYFISAYDLPMNLEESTSITFRPNEKQSCKYYKDGLLVFSGKFKLNEVKILNGYYTFDCTLYSNTVDYFAKLKDKRLGELDWSEYDHLLTRPNVINSWNVGIVKNGLANRNFGADDNGWQPKGYGYIYPLIDYGYEQYAPSLFRVTDLTPFVYVKECVSKIFDFALEGTGYSVDLTSGIFASDNFTKLIYGFGGGEKNKLNSDTINKLRVTNTGTTDNVIKNMTFLGKVAGKNQYQHIETYNPLFYSTYNQTSIVQDINKTNVFGQTIIYSAGKYSLRLQGSFKVKTSATTPTAQSGSISLSYKINSNSYLITQKLYNISDAYQTYTFDQTIDVNLGINDVLELSFKLTTAFLSDSASANVQYEWTALSMDLQSKEGVIVDNSIITLSNFIPEIKCSEFLTGIMNMFYLYVSDPIDNVITIGTLKDFYQEESLAEDWSDKVDVNKEMVIQSNAFVEGSNYIFRYNEEKDYFNTEYRNITGHDYGRYDLAVDTWNVGDRVWQLPFSQYVPIQLNNSLMKIISVREQDGAGNKKPYKGKGMIMYYNGIRSGNNSILNNDNDTRTNNTYYPFVHHFRFANDFFLDAPRFDLHFSSRLTCFDDIKAYPSLNLFNLYHAKFVNELTSIDSKLLNLYMRLTNKDINELDFSRLKKINGVLYRLNFVKDFDSDAFESTEVELLKYLR